MRASLRAAVLLSVSASFVNIHQAACEARPPAYSIDTEPLIYVDAKLETPLAIRLGVATPLPKQTMVLISGLTSSFSLTEGRLFDSGVWVVPTAELPRLKVMAANQAVGAQVPLTISLVSLEGAVLAKKALTLVVKQPTDTTDSISPPQAAKPSSTAGEAKAAARGSISQSPQSGLAQNRTSPSGQTDDLADKDAQEKLFQEFEAWRKKKGN
jgi:hypothetical protein